MSVATQTFFFTQTVRLYPLPSLYYVGINFGREVLGMEIDREAIVKLQMLGYGYKKISAETGMSINSVKSFCRRHSIAIKESLQANSETCLFCGKPIKSIDHHRKRKYCSDACRMAWWNAHHSEPLNRKMVAKKCVNCGKEFFSYPSKQKKYCSRSCFISAMQRRCRV